MTFHGTTFDAQLDGPRLETALGRVYVLMLDGQWRTLAEIAELCKTSVTGASARLRQLRNEDAREQYPNGGVNARRVSGGLWEYQLLAPVPERVRQGMLFDTFKDASGI